MNRISILRRSRPGLSSSSSSSSAMAFDRGRLTPRLTSAAEAAWAMAPMSGLMWSCDAAAAVWSWSTSSEAMASRVASRSAAGWLDQANGSSFLEVYDRKENGQLGPDGGRVILDCSISREPGGGRIAGRSVACTQSNPQSPVPGCGGGQIVWPLSEESRKRQKEDRPGRGARGERSKERERKGREGKGRQHSAGQHNTVQANAVQARADRNGDEWRRVPGPYPNWSWCWNVSPSFLPLAWRPLECGRLARAWDALVLAAAD